MRKRTSSEASAVLVIVMGWSNSRGTCICLWPFTTNISNTMGWPCMGMRTQASKMAVTVNCVKNKLETDLVVEIMFTYSGGSS